MATYNRLNLTKLTLQSLFATADVDFELIIVDNASSDETIEYIKTIKETYADNKYFVDLKLIQNTENKGIAYARNQGLLNATGDWLSTIDNDVEFPEKWLSESIDILRKNPKFGMVGVNMENVSYPLITSNGKEFQLKPVGNLGTACTVFPRSFHKMLGFFTTDFGLYAHEDADMGMRARVVGYQLGYIKENGKHLGEGTQDIGEYREFKTQSHRHYLAKFNENCRAYAAGKKSIHIKFQQ